jgi:hypothetical protein
LLAVLLAVVLLDDVDLLAADLVVLRALVLRPFELAFESSPEDELVVIRSRFPPPLLLDDSVDAGGAVDCWEELA